MFRNNPTKRHHGQSTVEYGLLIGMVFAILVLAMPMVSQGMNYVTSSLNNTVNSAIGGGNPAPAPPPTPVPPTTYRTAVLALSPVGYWRLGEASGTVLHDEMGAHNGTTDGSYCALGDTGLLTGDADTAMSLDGTAPQDYTNRISLSAGFFDPGVASYSVMLWANADASPPLHNYGLVTNGNAYFGSGWFALIGGDNHIWVFVHDTTPPFGYSYTQLISTSALSAGRHQIGLVFDRGAQLLRLNVDGVADASTVSIAGLGYIGDSGATVDFGYYTFGGPGGVFGGTIDEPAIWTRAVSDPEFAAMYAAGTGS